MMIRIAGATHDSEKGLGLFYEMETNGFIETTKHYNAIISTLGTTKRYAEKAIEFWHKMRIAGIAPDRHTLVAVLKACSKLGDIETAFDAVQETKIHGVELSEHSYNGLIKVYAGAAALRRVKEEHIDTYIKDAWKLYK
jgi:pentatricopeptide repeat protein